ncbi:MAG: hypothetical protein H0X17_16220, partial [Deltaproteobacteria bacterium]|nr:hypothetical protein [Deltaproteobacteria bacterium]
MRSGSVVVVSVLVGCYQPAPAPGAPCDELELCPSSQECSFGTCEPRGSTRDASIAIDATLFDAPASCTTWSPAHFEPCAIPAPGGPLHLTTQLSPYKWDSDTGTLRGKGNTVIAGVVAVAFAQPGGPEAAIASLASLTIDPGVTLTLTGSRPWVLAVWGDATVAGTIDASANLSAPASGSDPLACAASTGGLGVNGPGGGGGGGGAFQGAGGTGGMGDADT